MVELPPHHFHQGLMLRISSIPQRHRRRDMLGGLAAALLGGSALTGGFSGCAALHPTASRVDKWPSITPPTSSPERLYRLVNRATWGASAADLAQAQAMGYAGWVRHQLHAPAPSAAQDGLPPWVQARIDAMSVQKLPLDLLMADVDSLRRAQESATGEEPRRAAQQRYQRELGRLVREASTRHVWRALHSPYQVREHMTWFWFNHFNVHQFKANLRAMVGDYEDRAIRPHALGRFRDLLGAVLHHPAMLRYLDNEQNAAGRPNENLGRELLELHTLGVDAPYSQRDVQELSRVLTGHGVNLTSNTPRVRADLQNLYRRAGLYEFNPARHDFGDKVLLGYRLQSRGAAELDEALDLLAQHPHTARFISRKLVQFFLGDAPAPGLVDRMSRTFLDSQGHIGQVLEVLFLDLAFSAAGTPAFKDPMHFVLSGVRAAHEGQVILNTVPVLTWFNRLGQGLYNRQTPDGYPLSSDAWNGSGQMATRFEIARQMGTSAAGLFRPEDPSLGVDQPHMPQLATDAFKHYVQAGLRPTTRDVLAAATARDWNALYLASPDFMER